MSKMLNTIDALELALSIECDIEVTDDEDRLIWVIENLLTETDRQRVLKLANLYTVKYRPQLVIRGVN